MAITYDPAKRDWTLRERGLDFDDAPEVFAGRNYRRRDDRHDYGEARIITVGFLRAEWWWWSGRHAALIGTSFR